MKPPFPCNQCPKAFSISRNLNEHLRTNSGENPFSCNQCCKAFSVSRNLKQHIRAHSGGKPVPCNQCPKAVLNGVSLKLNLQTTIKFMNFFNQLLVFKYNINQFQTII